MVDYMALGAPWGSSLFMRFSALSSARDVATAAGEAK
jgi:hypothetical protein